MDKTASSITVKDVDLAKGFSSWHVKWPVGILGDNFKRISAKYSALGENVPEKDKPIPISFWLYLSISDSTELPEPIIRVCLFHFWPRNLPVFYRFALCYEGEDPVFGSAHYLSKDDRAKKENFPVGAMKRDAKLTVHCWVDIPTAVLKQRGTPCTKRKYCDEDEEYEMPTNIANFAAIGEGMFKGVIGADKVFQGFSDITLVAKKADNTDGRRFFCDRKMLASRSSVFLRMFAEQSWKEGEDRMVDIEDIDAEIMEIVLYHIYTGKFKAAEPDLLPSIVYAADKYHLNDLKDWAVYQLLTGDFSDADRADHLLLAERHSLLQLKAACIAMLSSNFRLTKNEEVYGKLSKELLKVVFDAMGKRQLDSTHVTVTTYA